MAVYCPGKHTCLVKNYMADFSTLLEHHSTSSAKTIGLVDFNIHVGCSEKSDAAQFIDLLRSADLQQHVHWPTHTNGHTLNLVISDSDNTVVTDVRPRLYLITSLYFLN